MGTAHSTSGADRSVEFYLPGTFQFSRRAGRIERTIRRLFQNRDAAVRNRAGTVGREFYLPGTP